MKKSCGTCYEDIFVWMLKIKVASKHSWTDYWRTERTKGQGTICIQFTKSLIECPELGKIPDCIYLIPALTLAMGKTRLSRVNLGQGGLENGCIGSNIKCIYLLTLRKTRTRLGFSPLPSISLHPSTPPQCDVTA